ncbi:MAG: (deoxy)nucleoside triphosphate pyrophosphohydrolase [Oscillospiraceae bacterium]
MREVTAAIIRRSGKILICRRAEGSCARLWEFPGGKTEPGETPFECLTRELLEELNIEIKPLREYCRSVYGELSFVFIEAEIVSGEPQLSVHEEMRWVKPEELAEYEWCPADKPVAEKLSK